MIIPVRALVVVRILLILMFVILWSLLFVDKNGLPPLYAQKLKLDNIECYDLLKIA